VELVIGRVARSHGVHGEIVVDIRTDEPEQRFAVGTQLHARRQLDRHTVEHTVVGVREHSGRLLVRLADVDDRAGADALRGLLFVIDHADLPAPTDPAEFYDHELVGMDVVLTDGTAVGTVLDVLHGAAAELLSIRPAGCPAGEHLVPFVAAIVTSVDRESGTMVIDPPDGLLEM